MYTYIFIYIYMYMFFGSLMEPRDPTIKKKYATQEPKALNLGVRRRLLSGLGYTHEAERKSRQVQINLGPKTQNHRLGCPNRKILM